MNLGCVLLLLFVLSNLNCSLVYSLCNSSRPPFKAKTPLKFCPYNGSSCCNSAEDLQIQKQFQAKNVSDPACASILKSILCASCDPLSAKLFKVDLVHAVPLLCNAKNIEVSHQSKTSIDYCPKVWDSCADISIQSSPFSPMMPSKTTTNFPSSPSKVSDLWESSKDFCHAFGGSSKDGHACFSGGPVSYDNTEATKSSDGLCLEKIGNDTYLQMVPHPDGSNHVFLGNKQGKIWMAKIPEQGSNKILEMNESKPFIDIADYLLFDTEFGLLSMAFHPNFARNGRFFISFNCNKLQQPNCMGRCSCNTDVNCDPSKLSADNGAQPCQYHSVIGEFTVNSTALEPLLATVAKPMEVRRILTLGLPFRGVHAGQILFGPKDGYLYCMTGDGSRRDDPYNLAQNKNSLLGKILRLDVDDVPSGIEINDRGLWGNYSIPKDNPYVDDNELAPEIFALGLRNPWRCSFDLERPSYFFCGDVGQEQYEEINMITKGANYGWRVYEGPNPFYPKDFPGGNTSATSIEPVFPVIYYNHSQTNNKIGSASAIGGYFYRSMTDPCLYGKYIFADLYGEAIFGATEIPENGRNFTAGTISFRCANDSPMKCSFLVGSAVPALGYIISLGEDNNKDLYFLTTTGVYRVVEPWRCNLTCSKGKTKQGFASPRPNAPSSVPVKLSGGCDDTDLHFAARLLVLCIGLYFLNYF